MEFKQIVMSRYATKKFDGKSVDAKKMDELMEIIRLTPSSFNLQPWKIKIITDKDTKEKLKAVAWNQEQVTTCSHLLVFCANTDIEGNIDKIEAQMKTAGAPESASKGYVQMMRDFCKKMSAQEKLVWAQKQVYLALENALLGAKSLGFDSCPMEGFDAGEFAKILKLPKQIVPTVICPVGYAADKPHPKMRFSKEDIFF